MKERPNTMSGSGPKELLPNNNFDLLRLLFAGMVVLYHVAVLSQAQQLAWMHEYISSTFAVQAFFVVSGFLVMMSFENSKSLRIYWNKRIRRLAPAYIFVVVITATLCVELTSLSPSTYFSSIEFWKYVASNLVLANFAVPALPGVFSAQHESAVNVSLWTIKIEVMFYACVPFIAWAVHRWGYQRALITVFLFSLLWKAGFFLAATVDGDQKWFTVAKQLPGQLSFFSGGAWAYYRNREGRTISHWWAILGIAAYVLTTGVLYEITAPFAVVAVVYWAAICAPYCGNVGRHGDFSYGIYLSHAPIVQALISFGIFERNAYLGLVLVMITVGLFGVFSWNYIESPFLRRNANKIPREELLRT